MIDSSFAVLKCTELDQLVRRVTYNNRSRYKRRLLLHYRFAESFMSFPLCLLASAFVNVVLDFLRIQWVDHWCQIQFTKTNKRGNSRATVAIRFNSYMQQSWSRVNDWMLTDHWTAAVPVTWYISRALTGPHRTISISFRRLLITKCNLMGCEVGEELLWMASLPRLHHIVIIQLHKFVQASK